ncbi:hypothetical protein ACOMHN_057096 [Nucella lapillus]
MTTKITGKPSYSESKDVKYTFYDTIEEFGYHFNEKGELVDKDGGEFNFFVKEGDRNYNQQHYDALGELITEYLYNKMETDLHLHKVFVPVDADKAEPQGFIFSSQHAAQSQKLMVIINGAGVVRAGQWTRKLIINEGINVGSQFPYIRRAQAAGYGVIVLNTNQNQQVVNGKAVDIRGSESAENHGVYVWEHIIGKAKATDIVIVAHSYGGIVTCNMAEKFLEDFKKRVFCIVFTDSVHTVTREQWSQPVKGFLKERAVNFASAYVPLDFMMQASYSNDCLSVSAGTEEHERTSHACIDSAFHFIQSNQATWSTDGSMAPRHFKPLPEDLSEFSWSNRWSRRMEKEGEQGTSADTGDEPSTSATKKRSATDGQEDSLSKNGGRGQGEEKTDPKTVEKKVEVSDQDWDSAVDTSDKAQVSAHGQDSAVDTSDKAEVQLEASQEPKAKSDQDRDSAVDTSDKAQVPAHGQDSSVDTSDKAQVQLEAGQEPRPAVSSMKHTEDTQSDRDQDGDHAAVQQAMDTLSIHTDKAGGQLKETEGETEGRERKIQEVGSDIKHETEGVEKKAEEVGSDIKHKTEGVEKKAEEVGSDIKHETEGVEKKAEEVGSEIKDRKGASDGDH